MPGKIKVRILGARHLPIMDRASELTDAFVEIKFGNQTQKTEVIRKSLNPQWNSEWFRFEVDDEELQDEPLQIRVMDHDTYSAHDAIGKVYLDLNPLLCHREDSLNAPSRASSGVVLNGWLPIFDTMHGIRGDVNLIVKVDLFSDLNRYRHSSCGVHFFSTPGIPRGYAAESVFGFVEELVVNDDPEYKWIDKIRTPRASNEARQRLFSTMSGAVQRKIGLKVQEMGGNAAIGYQQAFDLEGESGIVVRGIATAVRITKIVAQNSNVALPSPHSLSPAASPQPTDSEQTFWSPPQGVRSVSPMPTRRICGGTAGRRKSSDSDTEAPPPSASKKRDRVPASAGPYLGQGLASGAVSSGNPDHGKSHPRTAGILDRDGGGGGSGIKAHHQLQQSAKANLPFHRPVQKPIDFLDYPFFTITTFPPGYLVHIGGVVSARSVKLLDRILHPEEPETRDAWWAEIRTEIRSHCRAMGCHAVVGYSESTSISEDVCILSAFGTAARINVNALPQIPFQQLQQQQQHPACGGGNVESGCGDISRLARQSTAPILAPGTARKDSSGAESGGSSSGTSAEKVRACKSLHVDVQLANQYSQRNSAQDIHGAGGRNSPIECSLCHVPYDEAGVPFPTQLSACSFCRHGKVPTVLFATIEPPESLPILGKGCLIQARVCRSKKEWRGELNAKDISDTLPFLEYELHHQLLNKLRLNGMNALFGFQSKVHVGYNILVAIATATAVNVSALPAAVIPTLVCKTASSAAEEAKLARLQAKITDVARRNAQAHCVDVDRRKMLFDEYAEEAVPSEVVQISKRTEIHGSHPDINPNEGGREAYIIEVDDPEDMEAIDIMLEDSIPYDNIDVCNTELLPGVSPSLPPPPSSLDHFGESQITQQMFASIVRRNIGPNGLTQKQFAEIFSKLMDRLRFKLRGFRPCVFSKLVFDVSVDDSELMQIAVTGMCTINAALEGEPVFGDERGKEISCDAMQFKMDGLPIQVTEERTPDKIQPQDHPPQRDRSVKEPEGSKPSLSMVEVTPMSFLPGFQVSNYLGNMNLFVIRETSSVREFGGISGFMHKFMAEVLALMRAHVAALGGNALLAFNLNQCVLLDNPNRNQAQCLINIAGDAAFLEPEKVGGVAKDILAGANGIGVAKTVFTAGRSASPQSPKMRPKHASHNDENASDKQKEVSHNDENASGRPKDASHNDEKASDRQYDDNDISASNVRRVIAGAESKDASDKHISDDGTSGATSKTTSEKQGLDNANHNDTDLQLNKMDKNKCISVLA